MIYDDYIDYSKTYTTQYGDKTLVLMEVGSFFEIYAIDNAEEKSGADIYPVCDLLNLQVSRKNKAIVENNRANPLMAGFPSHALSKHTQALLSNGYTVVLVRQVTPPPNPKREVTEILSPAMQLQPTGTDGNYLMVALWDMYEDATHRKYHSVGVAGVDVSTGATFVYEVASTANDPNLSMDEFIRVYQTYQPRELVLLGPSLAGDEIEALEMTMGVKYETNRSIHRLWNKSMGDYAKVSYQNLVLRRAYPDTRMLDPIDALHLERYDNARMAFVYMIQFGYEHNENVIKYLQMPKIHQYHGFCTLEYNSAVQLNVISTSHHGNEKPLLSWLNRCATAFGGRRFRDRILHPICDESELERRYNQIDSYIQSNHFLRIHKRLKDVMDLERMVRRMKLGTFSPTDWPGFDASLTAILDVASEVSSSLHSMTKQSIDGYATTLVMDECAKYLLQDIRGNIFHTGLYKDVDELSANLQQSWGDLNNLVAIIDAYGNGEAGCKIENNERDGICLTTTKRRWQLIQNAMKENNVQVLEGRGGSAIPVASFQAKPISATSTTLRIKHPWIDACADNILKANARIQTIVTQNYREFLTTYIENHRALLDKIIDAVADLDICVTCAKNAVEYGYKRPKIVKSEDQEAGSFVRMKDMRHPILERLLDREMYVPNDIAIGEDGTTGILLFGINASGKSSLMKAVGLNVLMAQAGMFVAASQMELAPYSHIFTRIASADNIYKGWSTFTVEMLELKNILHRCDNKSLVLGDELCSGTESVSALAIVSAGIEMLRKRRTSFIFATHLHDLSNMKRIQGMNDVSMQHMHIEIGDNGKIIYDRKLRPGNGSAMYGLEVCKGLGLPMDFLKMAHEVRCDIQGIPQEYQSTTKTRYNAKVKKQECQVCRKNVASETHHIVPQKDADASGMIGHYHKNRSFNLVNLCEDCHHEVHHGDLHIQGYVMTSDGAHLQFTHTNK